MNPDAAPDLLDAAKRANRLLDENPNIPDAYTQEVINALAHAIDKAKEPNR